VSCLLLDAEDLETPGFHLRYSSRRDSAFNFRNIQTQNGVIRAQMLLVLINSTNSNISKFNIISDLNV
jgi:hypothetical protein